MMEAGDFIWIQYMEKLAQQMKIEGRSKEMRKELNTSFWRGNTNSDALG